MLGADQVKLLSDVDLVVAMCTEQEDHEIYIEFIRRFLPEVKKECLQICKNRNLHSHVGIQIAHDVFESVRKSKSFTKEKINQRDPHKAVFVYLIRIAVRQFSDHHRKEKQKDDGIHSKAYFDDLFSEDAVLADPENLLTKKETALKILRKLNKKEQLVVVKDIEYKHHQKYLPDDITENLAAELGVKKDTIRKIRERAITKLKKAIDEINGE